MATSLTWTCPKVKAMREKKATLQARCRRRGLDDTGNKQDLVNRLYDKQSKAEQNGLMQGLGQEPLHDGVEPAKEVPLRAG